MSFIASTSLFYDSRNLPCPLSYSVRQANPSPISLLPHSPTTPPVAPSLPLTPTPPLHHQPPLTTHISSSQYRYILSPPAFNLLVITALYYTCNLSFSVELHCDLPPPSPLLCCAITPPPSSRCTILSSPLSVSISVTLP